MVREKKVRMRTKKGEKEVEPNEKVSGRPERKLSKMRGCL